MRSSVFPHRPPANRAKNMKAVRMDDEGIEGKIPKYAWLTDGPLREIEKGPEISSTLPPALDPSKKSQIQLFVDVLVEKPYLKDYQKMYGELGSRYPEIDLRDPDMMCQAEKQLIAQFSTETAEQIAKQSTLKVRVPDPKKPKGRMTSRIPLDAHLRTWGGAIPYYESQIFDVDDEFIVQKAPPKRKMATGIYGPPRVQNGDSSGLIRECTFEYITQDEIDRNRCDDDSQEHLVIHKENTRTRQLLRARSKTGEETVKECMKKFFDPKVGIPFVPADIGLYFPLELLVQKEEEEVSDKKSAENPTMLFFDEDPMTECVQKSTLVDTSDQDILFTKGKAPYTRNEVASIRAFMKHWEDLKFAQKDFCEEEMVQRDKLIRESFHSKTVFETYLRLLEEEQKRIRSGVIGKSPYRKQSIWEVAAREAPKDYASIRLRRDFWWRFATYVRCVTKIKDPLEKDVIRTVREMMMKRHEILPTLFWDLVDALPKTFLENVPSLRLVEFVRELLNVSQDEFKSYFEKQKVTRLFYNQVVSTNYVKDNSDRITKLTKGPMEVPEFE